jgi:hypothetical protein
MRKFEVVSKVFGEGILTLQGDFGWLFEGNFKGTGYVLSGTWRILSAKCPADWHKDQAGMGMEDREDNPAFLTPSGKWLTIVTDIGEVLGFEIVRDMQ